MAERTTAFQSELERENADRIAQASSEVHANVEQFIKKFDEEFDFPGIAKRIVDFGRENPIGLAVSALTLGFAVGALIRSNPTLNSTQKKAQHT